MPYVELIREAWAKASDEQRRKMALALAGMVDKLVPTPVVLIEGQGERWPDSEQIRRSQAAGFPVVHVHFGEPPKERSLGTVRGQQSE
jgi:hypothetical protein